MGKLAHPMVLHFWEQHEGRQQPVLMRVTSKHLMALERQVRESINIEKCARNITECLNLKNEWAGSKIPGIKVTKPKGVTMMREGDTRGTEESMEIVIAAMKRGVKRMEYVSDSPEVKTESKLTTTEGEEDNLDLDLEPGEREENKLSPPRGKRQRIEMMGEGWEAVSPVKWKQSPLSEGSKTFSSLNIEGRREKWDPEPQERKDDNRRTAEMRRTRRTAPDKVTPVKVKIKRLETDWQQQREDREESGHTDKDSEVFNLNKQRRRGRERKKSPRV